MKQQLKTVGMYQAFSNFVNKTAEDALSKAIVESIKKWVNAHKNNTITLEKIPISLFIVGGDDISLAIHSELAFKFIESFSYQINQKFGSYCSSEDLKQKIGDTNITFYPSGYSGACIFHQSTVPLQIVNEIADELENKSKKFSKFYLSPYKDWRGLNKDELDLLLKQPYYPRCLGIYKKEGARIIGGAYNTISLYYSTADISNEAVNRYYNAKTFKYYATALFPMDIEAFKEDFIGKKMYDLAKIVKSNENQSNIVKSILRKGILTIPEEFKLSLFYKAGKESGQKSEFWQKMANTLTIKGKEFKDEDTGIIKSLIDWYEPSEYLRFYWEE